jgi:hypothetical protein
VSDLYSTIVKLQGFDFEFSGEWVGPVAATESDPPEGGYFEEYLIELDGKNVLDLLNQSTIDHIVKLAIDEKLRGG